MSIRVSKSASWAIVLTALAGAAAYGVVRSPNTVQASNPKSDAQSLPSVELFTASVRELRSWDHFSGRLSAVNSAEIRPRVSGRISEVKFSDGQTVKTGDVLFVIDPKPYEAAVDGARASLFAAKTQSQLAQLELTRAQSLIKAKAIAGELFDAKNSAAKVTSAAVGIAEARLREAEIDLDYAYVKAPISGRISRAEITLGNNVEAGPQAPLLATVVDLDKLYAEFQVDEATYASILAGTSGKENQEQDIPVHLATTALKGGTDVPSYPATLLPFDNQLNTESGAVRARAIVDNQLRTLAPGLFVTVTLGSVSTAHVLELPERSIGVDQSKRFVYAVDAEGVVLRREVQLGSGAKGFRRVLQGITAGERIVTSSIDKVRPGMKVQGVDARLSLPDV